MSKFGGQSNNQSRVLKLNTNKDDCGLGNSRNAISSN